MAVFAYLIGDSITGDALIIDPADNVHHLLALATNHKLSGSTTLSTLMVMLIISAAMPKCKNSPVQKLSFMKTMP